MIKELDTIEGELRPNLTPSVVNSITSAMLTDVSSSQGRLRIKKKDGRNLDNILNCGPH